MRSNINHIRVHSNSDCILHQYDLMASDRDAPGNPTGSGSDWFRVGHMDNGTGDDDFMFNMAEVMHVAVKIESDGCGNFFGWRHDVSEIEVWTAPNAPPPPPQPPTCAGGGG
jgi:hypothetical protein